MLSKSIHLGVLFMLYAQAPAFILCRSKIYSPTNLLILQYDSTSDPCTHLQDMYHSLFTYYFVGLKEA